MAFIIIDLEFNNLSEIHKYYPNIYKDIPNLKELDLINEIIEIGAIKVDMYMKPLEELKVYIKPSVIPVVNPKILSITNIKHEELENGVSFNEGLDMLKNMVDKGDIICSWAKDDIGTWGFDRFRRSLCKSVRAWIDLCLCHEDSSVPSLVSDSILLEIAGILKDMNQGFDEAADGEDLDSEEVETVGQILRELVRFLDVPS